MSEVLDRPQTQATAAVAEYNATEAALADLRSRFANVAFDLSTTKGDKEARAARSELVKLRTTLDARRKEIKAPLLERSRLIDAEAKRITDEIVALETPIDAQIKAAEAAKEAERKAKAEAEAARAEQVQAKISAIRSHLASNVAADSTGLRTALEFVESVQISEAEYGEYEQAADRAKAETVKALQSLLGAALAREAQAAALAAAQAELAAKQAELDRQIAAAAAAAAAAEAQAQAEKQAFEAQARAEREAIEAKAKAEREAAEAQAKADTQAKAEADAAAKAKADAEAKAIAEAKAKQEAEARALLEAERAEAKAREARLEASASSLLHSLSRAVMWMSSCHCLDAAGAEIVQDSNELIQSI